MNRKLSIIVNVPVSRYCNMHVLADGPYNRRAIEAFIRQLQLHVDLGAFDETTAPIMHEVVPGVVLAKDAPKEVTADSAGGES